MLLRVFLFNLGFIYILPQHNKYFIFYRCVSFGEYRPLMALCGREDKLTRHILFGLANVLFGNNDALRLLANAVDVEKFDFLCIGVMAFVLFCARNGSNRDGVLIGVFAF